MATKVKSDDALKALEDELRALANAQFQSEEYRRMLETPFTLKGAQEFFLQHAQFNLNRRDCWGYVQARSPLAVKKLVWEHEEEELAGVPSRGGLNHYELAVKQGEAFGLTPEDYAGAPTLDGTYVCSQAWISLAQNAHWLEAVAASAALEFSNSDAIVEGGGVSRRLGAKLEAELGIPMRKQPSNEEHTTAEIEHAMVLMKVAHMYADEPRALDRVLEGAKKSWAIDRVFRGFLGALMQKHAG